MLNFLLNPKITDYISCHTTPEDPILVELYKQTYLELSSPQMISGHLQGQLLSFISKMIYPQYILEIGTFTGYSAICLAQGLKENGKLITIDSNKELENIIKKYAQKAGLSQKIISYIGDALEIIPTLDKIFDLVFIDAKKQSYSHYYDLIFEKVSKGGIILVDNVLFSGKVVDSEAKDKSTQSIREFNKKIQHDPRVENIILPIRDGLSLIRKR